MTDEGCTTFVMDGHWIKVFDRETLTIDGKTISFHRWHRVTSWQPAPDGSQLPQRILAMGVSETVEGAYRAAVAAPDGEGLHLRFNQNFFQYEKEPTP